MYVSSSLATEFSALKAFVSSTRAVNMSLPWTAVASSNNSRQQQSLLMSKKSKEQQIQRLPSISFKQCFAFSCSCNSLSKIMNFLDENPQTKSSLLQRNPNSHALFSLLIVTYFIRMPRGTKPFRRSVGSRNNPFSVFNVSLPHNFIHEA